MAVYNYCSKCGKKLLKNSGGWEFSCANCSSKYYQNSKPTVGVLVTDDQNRVLLTKRSLEVKHGMWGMPGGFLKIGEYPIDGAIRETEEEIGVELKDIKFMDFIVEDNPYGENEFMLGILFEAKIKSGIPEAKDETSEVKWFEESEIPWGKIAFDGNIKALKIHYGKI